MGNLMFRQMVAGQAEIDRKRKELEWFIQALMGFLKNYRPIASSYPSEQPRFSFGASRPFGKEMLGSIGISSSGVGQEAELSFYLHTQTDCAEGLFPVKPALKRTNFLRWLYEEADGFIEAVREYLNREDVEKRGKQSFEWWLKEFVPKVPRE